MLQNGCCFNLNSAFEIIIIVTNQRASFHFILARHTCQEGIIVCTIEGLTMQLKKLYFSNMFEKLKIKVSEKYNLLGES